METSDIRFRIIFVCLILAVCGIVLGNLWTRDPQISRNFKLCEFASPDTGEAKMDMQVKINLQKVRDHFGKKVVVISGYRTPTHNRNIGGKPNSLHLKGMAVDWYVEGVSAREMAQVARECGFTGIGIYKYSVHTDIGESETWYGK